MSSIIRLRNLGWPNPELETEMGQLMQRFFPREADSGSGFFPAANISETDENIFVTLDVPGVDSKDLDIAVVGDVLTIKGERKPELTEKKEHTHRVERTYGAFTRSFQLAATVVLDKVNADYKNGVLRVTLPKTDESRRREVKIKVG